MKTLMKWLRKQKWKMVSDMEEMLLTVPEVAQVLKTNEDYVYKLQKAGLLRFIKVGRWKVRKSTLEEFLKKYDGFDISDPFSVKAIEGGEVNEG